MEHIASPSHNDNKYLVASGGSQMIQEKPSPELENKSRKAGDKLSEILHIIVNEPSLAVFRIQEHVRKTLPQLVDVKHDMEDVQQDVQGACFDMEYAAKAVQNMEKSETHFRSIQDLLKNSMFIRQQLQYEQSRKDQERNRPSMYRTMLRTQTIDLSTQSATSARNVLSHANTVDEDTPQVRSSMSSHSWMGPASLLR
ncbi:hypothetical protein LSH36_352g03073 [Paralvinella palmiformis]|uniref:Uncharacterized protein n=1 Tax=Paralvinella palmiformis TaxID=53620 RepID=A0AAD9JF01_9ANNE|nr:hypothetical protein LSH36_352g03073 [Paralvinella palmiformis]